jgi:hypothetical protein
MTPEQHTTNVYFATRVPLIYNYWQLKLIDTVYILNILNMGGALATAWSTEMGN